MPITISLETSDEIAAQLSNGIIDFNRHSIPDLEPNDAETRFHVLATDDAEQVIGGLRGLCYWNTLHIELLWLGETARGSGIGSDIMKAAEAFAIEKGCGKALVETTSWQAKPFYERSGYDLLATLPDRPKGHASYYLVKTLT